MLLGTPSGALPLRVGDPARPSPAERVRGEAFPPAVPPATAASRAPCPRRERERERGRGRGGAAAQPEPRPRPAAARPLPGPAPSPRGPPRRPCCGGGGCGLAGRSEHAGRTERERAGRGAAFRGRAPRAVGAHCPR